MHLSELGVFVGVLLVGLSCGLRVKCLPVSQWSELANQEHSRPMVSSGGGAKLRLKREGGSPSIDTSQVNLDYALKYLRRYGYIQDENEFALMDASVLTDGIKDYQRSSNLEVTGNLTEHTKKLLVAPRCAMRDIPERIGARRKKRQIGIRPKKYSTHGIQWYINRISYDILSYPSSMENRTRFEELIKEAFGIWSKVVNIKFDRLAGQGPMVSIAFVTWDHGDGEKWAFDGKGQRIAHASAPQAEPVIHFDDAEDWNDKSILYAAVHEIGHTLGLSHSGNENAVMFERLSPDYTGRTELSQDDIDGINSIYKNASLKDPTSIGTSHTDTHLSYGPNGGGWVGPPPVRNQSPSEAQDRMCKDPKIDAISWTDGVHYTFRGDYFWKHYEAFSSPDKEPTKIRDRWPGAPSNIDAALFLWPSGIIMFKGDSVWQYDKESKLSNGYPKKISRAYKGVPNDLDAAFYWGTDASFYFIKGNQYWRYKYPRVLSGYPKPLGIWKGVPTDRIDEGHWIESNTILFFKDDQVYFLNDLKSEVENQISLREWYNCPS